MSILITNIVLNLLGSQSVASINDSEWALVIEPTIQRFYRLLLQKNNWNFATKFSELAQNSVNTNPRYDYSLALPADFIRIKNVYHTESWDTRRFRYEILKDNLFSDEQDITISYVSSSIDVDNTDESFKLALAYTIIANLNARLLNNDNLVKYYEEKEKLALADAINLDNTQIGQLPFLYEQREYI